MKQRVEKGFKCVPLDTKPELNWDASSVWEAFWRLNHTRQYKDSGYPMGIQLTEIKAYCDIFGIDEPEEFIDLLQILDREFIALSVKKSQGDKGTSGNTG